MIWGVLSDVHSNLEALEASLAAMRREGAESFLCCGDLVGYGAQPNEVLETVRGLPNLVCVRGNHDLAALGRMALSWFNEPAQAAVNYTQQVLKPEFRDWLGSLPERHEGPGFSVVHGSPRDPAAEYLVTEQQFLDNCAHFKSSPCFIGHSHLPVCFLMKEPMGLVMTGRLEEDKPVRVPVGMRSVINAGSVGQPRDHDSRASCGVYDDRERTFRLLRVPYDVAAVQRKILDAGLPEFLALRLTPLL